MPLAYVVVRQKAPDWKDEFLKPHGGFAQDIKGAAFFMEPRLALRAARRECRFGDAGVAYFLTEVVRGAMTPVTGAP